MATVVARMRNASLGAAFSGWRCVPPALPPSRLLLPAAAWLAWVHFDAQLHCCRGAAC
jgi:hypothetical protein